MIRRVSSRRPPSTKGLYLYLAKILFAVAGIIGLASIPLFMTSHYGFFGSPGGDYVLEARVYNYERWFGLFPAPGDSKYAAGKVVLRDKSGRVLDRQRVKGVGFTPQWLRHEVIQPCRYYIRLPTPILAWDEKAYVLEQVRREGWRLNEASPELRDDEEVVKVALQSDPMALNQASPRLQEKLKKAE